MTPTLLLCLAALPAQASGRDVEFNRDVRPILSDACFACHGPDKSKRKADLRLDEEPGLRGVVTAGKPDKSELYRRLRTADEGERMPPAKHPIRLNDRQLDTVKRWIEQGAKWQTHWAFRPPQRPDVPALKSDWVRNPIDAFVLERLGREGLRPAPEADRVTLLRRVTLDLTGLPPTPAEVDAFLADDSANAYEKVVDRLLASPRFGERLAIRWMNAARYADTSGYQSDGERVMWRWRDWVLDAFNGNMPFDRFTVEQLAGDLLPGATLEQRIATGFNRNHRGNGEGGIIPEEYQVEYVVDRVETTATVWMGLTLGCARCHDHKFDPVSQREFYRLYAYFNNIPEHGRAIKIGNSPPAIPSPTREQQRELAALDERLARAKKEWQGLAGRLAEAQTAWEKKLPPTPAVRWYPATGLKLDLLLDGDAGAAQFRDGEPAWTASPDGKAADLDGKRHLDAGDVGNFGFFDRFTLAAWVRTGDGGTIISRMTDVEHGDGYALRVVGGKPQLNLVKRWLDDALHVETKRKLEPNAWHHVAVTYDGSRLASGVRFYIDGRPAEANVLLDELNQTFATKEPLRVGGGGGPQGRFRGAIAGVRVHADRLSDEEVLMLATPATINTLARKAPENRSPGEAARLRAYYLEKHAPDELSRPHRELRELLRQRERLVESFPSTMVMVEMAKPRDTHVLVRGEYDKHGEKVGPGVPSVLPPLPSAKKNDRLALARWLVDPGHPLTARVAVNRYWQMLFGEGLVKTVDDFGSQGEPPSHPELLDWLASEFVRGKWDVKAMHRLIVTSTTYRQASRTTADLLARDPENRLLARGPRFRLPAEVVRDQALAASGLLVEKVGGPSVKPYQPPGIEKELGADPYVQDHGDSLYRRGLYTFWKRTVAPPMMVTFDAPGREACMVRETRTNTPLQALTLLNDVTFVEAARVLAERVVKQEGTPEGRLTLAFRLVLARKPKQAELAILRASLDHYRDHYRDNPRAALRLLAVGERSRDDKLDPAEVAAYTTVAGTILNLHEAVTRE